MPLLILPRLAEIAAKHGIDLDELTKKELVEYAKNLGIEDVDTKNTKAEIIEKISSVDAPITEMP